MSDKVRKKLEARLRDGRDEDLKEATAGLSSGVLSEMVRDGMRLMLGIRTKMTTEIKERPLIVPPPDNRPTLPSRPQPLEIILQQKEKTASPSRPTVFKPSNR
ncbi:hypothetical protein [Paenibacillus methanolicus]|uniref:Uncharacterized protein n=1 Tax=Paenibacillus methanolicus TaxID=582686 RepID=A0A5S5BJY8_9BACL|nr:hypothetical protein [Paenibacillus methanolicus]TYP67387.1 hypothetical protein BCM02_1245 [Paenibacillus methanolicus]